MTNPDRLSSPAQPTRREFLRRAGGPASGYEPRLAGGCLRFGEVDWSEPQPAARIITQRAALQRWQSA